MTQRKKSSTLTNMLLGTAIAISTPAMSQAGLFDWFTSDKSSSQKSSSSSFFGFGGSGSFLGNTGKGSVDTNRDEEFKEPAMDMHMGGNTFRIGGDDSNVYCEKEENDKSSWYTMDFLMQVGPFELCYEHDMRDPGGSLYIGMGPFQGLGSINRDDKERGKVSGIVFVDKNSNDEFDMGDERLSGVKVKITDSKGREQIVTTNDKGSYKADDIAPGKVKIEVIANGHNPISDDNTVEVDVGACGTLCVVPKGYYRDGYSNNDIYYHHNPWVGKTIA